MSNEQFTWDDLKGQLPPPKRIFIVLALAIVLLVGVSAVTTSYYTVHADEEAVVLRLGKYQITNGPGFHFKAPFGIDKVFKGQVKTVHAEEFGYRTLRAGVQSEFDYRSPQAVSEALMLTGDLNLVVVSWEVRYRIKNLENYFFKVRNVPSTIRDVSQASMRLAVGDRSVDEVLTTDRAGIETTVATRMQATLDSFQAGVHIVKVNLKRAIPPAPVRDAFNAVNRAIQDRDRIINEAEGQRNKKIPAARGKAQRAIREAEGYQTARINRAEGETSAFLAVLAQYQKARDVTRARLYFETMEVVLPRVSELLLIEGGQDNVLKFLDLKRGGGRK
jgi:membrane protease subunit HflK